MRDESSKDEARYRRIAELTTDYLYEVRVEGGKAAPAAHSPACELVTGYSAAEFAADPGLWLAMVPEGEKEAVLARLEDLLAGKRVEALEHRIRCKDGSLRWVRDELVAHQGAGGAPASYDGVVRDITPIKRSEETLVEVSKSIAQREFETLSVLGRAAEYRDPETARHITRVAHTSRLLAKRMLLDAYRQDLVFHAAPLHDVGKLGIPDSLLLKPGPLSGEEFARMKTHAEIGHEILRSSTSAFLQAGAEIALSHHERFDGSGYPRALRGEAIPLFGRIVAVADSYDAMATRRPYKEAMPRDKVLAVMKEERGRQFDPIVVNVLLGSLGELLEIYEEFQD